MPRSLQIDRELIEHLSDLARLSLSSDQQADLRGKLMSLVQAFSSLSDAGFDFDDVADTAAPATPCLSPERLRADVAETTPPAEHVLANAPQTAAECFVVPRVVDA